ncbi:glycosyltransferase family 39 protein [Lysobacter xanthus]
MSTTARRLPGWAIAALAVVLALAFLGNRGIWDPDEGRYTNVALNMLATGDWLVPHRSPEVAHWTKPPLTYWAIAASVEAFGTNAMAARVPAALSYLLCVLLAGRIGRRLAPDGGDRAALVYATLLFSFGASQMITTDYVLAAMETLAVWAFVEARFGASRPRAWLALMWAGFGLAFLTKGPPGLLPLLPLVVFDALTRERGRPTAFQPLGLLAFVAIAAPWYLAVTSRTPGLMQYFLGNEVVGRIASNEFKRHGEWYGWLTIYAPTLLIGTLPWWRPLWRWLRGVPAQWRGWRDGETRRAQRAWLFATLWLLLPLAVFCISRSRLPLYILPLFVPIALLVTLQQLRDARPWPRLPWLLLWVAVLLGLKVASSQFPTHKNARDWAREIRGRMGPLQVGEVLFVEDMARYGVHLHLGRDVAVEKLSIEALGETGISREYDESLVGELAEHEPNQVWICKQERWAEVAARVRAEGFEPIVLGAPYQGRIIFRTVRR